jgi:hypothetical protein
MALLVAACVLLAASVIVVALAPRKRLRCPEAASATR